MKRQFTTIILTAGLSLLGSLTISAQDQLEVASIPFAFHANQTVMPAGKYLVEQRNAGGLFQLRSEHGKSIFLSAPVQKRTDPARPRLTFSRYGSEYLLSQISMAGNDVGYNVSSSALDKELSRKIGMAAMISVPLRAR